MGKYLKKFETTAEYTAFMATDYPKPNVSLVVEDNTLNYHPIRNDIITYKASAKLTETTSTGYTSGLHVNSFSGTSGQKLTMTSHKFDNGVGTIEFNSNIANIGVYAFLNCTNLTSIDIPNSVTTIGDYAFLTCSGLTSIDIPNSVTTIGNSAFNECRSLTSITVDSNNTVYDSRDNCNAIIKTSTNELIKGCNTTVIPSGVTSIGDNAFSYCSSLVSIDIPNSVTTIGNSAFQWCGSLTSIDIPNSVTSIGQYAFSDCSGLISVTCNPTTPPRLGSYAFNLNASGRKIYVPSASVNAYKAASNWKNYASSIQAIQ